MAEVISIRKMRENRDPDVFINQVLNDPARLDRVRQKQIEAMEKARMEAEEKDRKLKETEECLTFTVKTATFFCFVVVVVAALVAFIC